MFLVLTALLWAIRGTTARPAFYLGMLQAMTGYALSLAWLFRIFGFSALPLQAILALFTAVACGLVAWVARHARSDLAKVLEVAVLWTALEFCRCEWFVLRFPWATPGTAIGPTWLSPFLGAYGASFFMVGVCAALLWRRTRVGGVVGLCAMTALGFLRPGRVEPLPARAVAVALVQSEECVLQTYLSLTERALAGSPDLIVWPEYAVPYDVRRQAGSWEKLAGMSLRSGAVMVVGTQTGFGDGSDRWHNTALVLDRGEVAGEYHKARPVHFFDDGIAGSSWAPIRTRLGALGVLVCFDGDYTGWARRMVAAGAECLVVPSFDAADWSATQHRQHGELFRLRAAENGRWLACAASSGASQIIDPHGNTRAMLPVMEQGVLTGHIGLVTTRTFFNRVGWIFPWLDSAVAIGMMAWAAVRQLRLPRLPAVNP